MKIKNGSTPPHDVPRPPRVTVQEAQQLLTALRQVLIGTDRTNPEAEKNAQQLVEAAVQTMAAFVSQAAKDAEQVRLLSDENRSLRDTKGGPVDLAIRRELHAAKLEVSRLYAEVQALTAERDEAVAQRQDLAHRSQTIREQIEQLRDRNSDLQDSLALREEDLAAREHTIRHAARLLHKLEEQAAAAVRSEETQTGAG